MSYPVFLVVALFAALMLAGVLAGPLSILAIAGFWVAHWHFVDWSLNSASVKGMSDAELNRVLRDWTTRGMSHYSSSELSRAIRTGDRRKVDTAIARVTDIYDEAIRRAEKRGINVDHYRAERGRLGK